MNINVIYCLILKLLIIRWVNSSTSCSIFPSLNCSCFQSDFDLSISSPIKVYSHLYCQGNLLNKKTFQSPFGFDFKNQNRFRTISIEFSHQNQIEIHSNQFDSLALLFSQTPLDAKIEISIRFNHFNKIIFHEKSLTSNMFQKKHQQKHLSLHFIPKTINFIQKESGEDNSTGLVNQFEFSPDSLSGLTISRLNIYLHTLKDYFSSLYPFEYIFNNTNIGELHFHDSIIPPGPFSMRNTFKGLIRSLTLHRHVDTIDSTMFPYYFSVYSYNIQSVEAHSMDLDSFIPLYNNLRGLELLKPRFEVSINRLIPTLDFLSIDIEYLNDRTLMTARHINHFKLGSRLRRINPQVLNSLSTRLKTFDLSEIDLSEMTSDSRCYLIHFIKNYHRAINIIYPRIEYSSECDCARLILHDIRSIKTYKDTSICSKQCRFSDCPVISEYYREKFLSVIDDNQPIQVLTQTNDEDLPSVDLFADPIDVNMMRFLINQTDDNHKRSRLTTPSLSILEDFNSVNDGKNGLRKSKRFSWIPFVIGIVVALSLILLISIILFLIIKHKKQSHFKTVPVYV